MLDKYTWIPFYMELADKLLTKKNDRQYLISILNELDDKYIGYFRNYDNIPIAHIDPFTFIAVMNRGSSTASRSVIAKLYKERLGIESEIPTGYEGIPIVNAMRSYFLDKKTGANVEELWNLFEDAITCNEHLEESYNIAEKLQGINWNITMFLFWIRPYEFLPLDRHSREFLDSNGIKVTKVPGYAEYRTLISNVKDLISKGKLDCKDFAELSTAAWDIDDNEKKYWLAGFNFGSYISQYDSFIKEGVWYGSSDTNTNNTIEKSKPGDIIVLKSTYTKGSNHKISGSSDECVVFVM